MLRIAIVLLACPILLFATNSRTEAVKTERLPISSRYKFDFRKAVRHKSSVASTANSTVECALMFENRSNPGPQEGFVFNRKTLACVLMFDPVGPGRFVDATWMKVPDNR